MYAYVCKYIGRYVCRYVIGRCVYVGTISMSICLRRYHMYVRVSICAAEEMRRGTSRCYAMLRSSFYPKVLVLHILLLSLCMVCGMVSFECAQIKYPCYNNT